MWRYPRIKGKAAKPGLKWTESKQLQIISRGANEEEIPTPLLLFFPAHFFGMDAKQLKPNRYPLEYSVMEASSSPHT